MLRHLIVVLGLAAASTMLLTSDASAAAKKVTPEKGSVYERLYDGLKLIADGKFDTWVDDYCSKEKTCHTTNAIKSVRRYNLPSAKRQAPFCLKGKQLEVTGVKGDPATDTSVKIFIQCNPKGQPRPYQMVKEGGTWMFAKIY